MTPKIKAIREQMHMSQEEVAHELNVDRSTVSRMENGTQNISNDILAQLAQIYHTSTDDILGLPDYSISHIEQLLQEKKPIMSDYLFVKNYHKLSHSKKLILQLIILLLLSENE